MERADLNAAILRATGDLLRPDLRSCDPGPLHRLAARSRAAVLGDAHGLYRGAAAIRHGPFEIALSRDRDGGRSGDGGVLLLPSLVDTPVLLTLAIAGWISLCLYASLLDGTPRSYAFILAGYTTALIAFPSVEVPGDIFITAVARVEEITLGIVCMTVLTELVFPERVGPMLDLRTDAWFADLSAWSRNMLAGRRPSDKRVQLIARMAELETLRFHALHEDPALHATGDTFALLQRRMQMLLPILSGIRDRLRELPADGRSRSARSWRRRRPNWRVPRRRPMPCSRSIDAQIARERASDWAGTTRRSLLGLLREFVVLWEECRRLRAALAGNTVAVPERNMALEHHRDHRVAAVSALAAFIAIGLTTAIWIYTAWPQGYVAAEMAAVLCCLFARLDDPAPSISSFLLWSNVAAVIAAAYLFAILPLTNDFVPLVLVLAPTYLLLGLGMATQRFLGNVPRARDQQPRPARPRPRVHRRFRELRERLDGAGHRYLDRARRHRFAALARSGGGRAEAAADQPRRTRGDRLGPAPSRSHLA